jgi:hypothetical protein
MNGVLFIDEDLFVHGDGGVTGSVAVTRGVACPGCGWSTAIVQGSGTAAQFSALTSALGVNTVGLQHGDCVVATSVPSFGSYEVTWYGRAPRKNAFVVSLNGQGADCAPQVSAIIMAIEKYASEAHVPTSEIWSPF